MTPHEVAALTVGAGGGIVFAQAWNRVRFARKRRAQVALEDGIFAAPTSFATVDVRHLPGGDIHTCSFGDGCAKRQHEVEDAAKREALR